MQKSLLITASGRVQGVFFRASAKRVAEGYGLVGYARNLPDGRVEIVAEGEESGLRALLDWCYRGSLLANVYDLAFEWHEPTGKYSGFQIARDDGSLVVDQVHALTNLGRRVLNRVDKTVEEAVLKPPAHVVIIPDGNRRWARERDLPIWRGHQEGINRARELLDFASKSDINHMTLWGFSTENWSRSKGEVDWLMKAFVRAIGGLSDEMIKRQASFRHLGRKDRLSPKLASALQKLEEETAQFKDKTFAMALDYGGRDELVRAVNKASEGGEVSEESLGAALDTAGLPDPDLIIRTSGERRLSGIFPWQGVHSELYFTPLHFPDFTVPQFELALADYSHRQRRFGA